jgi:hypothetical protein
MQVFAYSDRIFFGLSTLFGQPAYAYLEKHQLGKQNRALKTTPTHHQGSRNLPAFKRAFVSDVIYLL